MSRVTILLQLKKCLKWVLTELWCFFSQENNREIIRKRTKRSWENNHRTIVRDTRGPDEITQEDLDNVADFSTRKVYNQVTVCILDRVVFRLQITAYWVKTAVARGGNGVYVAILKINWFHYHPHSEGMREGKVFTCICPFTGGEGYPSPCSFTGPGTPSPPPPLSNLELFYPLAGLEYPLQPGLRNPPPPLPQRQYRRASTCCGDGSTPLAVTQFLNLFILGRTPCIKILKSHWMKFICREAAATSVARRLSIRRPSVVGRNVGE